MSIEAAATTLVLAGFAFWLWTFTNKEDAAGNGCGRKGCRRMPAGQGCNHQPRTDGPASGHFHEED